MANDPNDDAELTANVSEIVSAYVGKNNIHPGEVPAFIKSVREALKGDPAPVVPAADLTEKATPAQIKKSMTPDALISFIDGKPYKSLKRHLTTNGLTPEGYRQKYGLPDSYPMVSENYSKQRAELARTTGLGRKKSDD